jgi:hypothetical protein
MANDRGEFRVTEALKSPVGTMKVNGGFKPSTPTGYVRPKPVPVPQKSK